MTVCLGDSRRRNIMSGVVTLFLLLFVSGLLGYIVAGACIE